MKPHKIKVRFMANEDTAGGWCRRDDYIYEWCKWNNIPLEEMTSVFGDGETAYQLPAEHTIIDFVCEGNIGAELAEAVELPVLIMHGDKNKYSIVSNSELQNQQGY